MTRPGAARLAALVLLSALLRAGLSPMGPAVSTLVFVACLGVILMSERHLGGVGEERWGRWRAALLGAGVGVVLVLPLATAGAPHGTFQGIWTWGAAIAVVATLEEAVLRGPLQRRWSLEAGPLAAIVATALVFAAIHLPAYGAAALPLDFAVGVALAGVRMVTGRILPCAVAHVLADWGAWFWS